MAVAALALYVIGFLLVFGLRTVMQMRRTGDTGWRGLPGRVGSMEWWAGLLLVAALAVGVAAPIADLMGLEPVARGDWLGAAGVVLASVGILLTFMAQVSMGDSWRIGLAQGERTDLVTEGAFNVVRNPIFSAMLLAAVGLTLMVPNVMSLVGLVALLVALELLVRGAEEPYLLRVHGSSYAEYAADVGRFAPRLGRLRASQDLRP